MVANARRPGHTHRPDDDAVGSVPSERLPGPGWVEDRFASVAVVDREEAYVGEATYAAVD